MEKRSAPITVALEPSIVELIKQQSNNISLWIHDVVIEYLSNQGALTPEYLAKRMQDAAAFNAHANAQANS